MMAPCPQMRATTIPLAAPPCAGRHPLDEVSKKIIEQLQQDGRRPYAAIAASVGLSEAAVRQRVQRFIKTGVVQIVAVTNPLHLGFSRQAMIGIRVDGQLDPVVAAISALDEVAYVVITAGSFDVLAEVVCEDDEHLLRIMNQPSAPSTVSGPRRPSCISTWPNRPTPGEPDDRHPPIRGPVRRRRSVNRRWLTHRPPVDALHPDGVLR